MLANILAAQSNPAPICIAAGTAISIVFALVLLVVDAARSRLVRSLKQQ
jgi:hypothetical protein